MAMLDTLLVSPVVLLAPRVLVVVPFVVSGVAKLRDFESAKREVQGLTGVAAPAPLAALVIATQLGGSALVVGGGLAACFGALLLAGFTMVATVLGHAWWRESHSRRVRDANAFWEHVALVGGLACVAILSFHQAAGRLS